MVLLIFALDLTAGVSKETGLLMVGGGIYVVIYSCTTLFAAMISVFVFKKALARHQWAGVLLLTFGLLLNGAGKPASLRAPNTHVRILHTNTHTCTR